MVHRPFRRSAPFDFARGTPAPGRYPPDRLDPHQAAEAIRYAPVEVGYGFDAGGRQVFRQAGDESTIWTFQAPDLHAIRAGSFIHNHPPYVAFSSDDPRYRAGSFSASDLAFMYDVDLVEMVVVTADRTYHVERPPDGFFLDSGQIVEEYRRRVRRIQDDRRRMRRAGLMTSAQETAQGSLADEVMDELGLFYNYRWEEAT